MMTKDDWASLAGSPGWPKLKQFWRDQRAMLMEGIARDKFPQGTPLNAAIIECQLLLAHAELDLATIDKFYGAESTEEEAQNES